MTELMLVMMISEMAVTGDKEDKMLTVKCYLVSEHPFSIHKLMQIVMSSVSLLSATYPLDIIQSTGIRHQNKSLQMIYHFK